ncbi:MAG TPA: hypothetical protein DIU39_01370 [Flavobacteriales bacterium]|nr:hypothetical protein [Flavobacteriales bacterium]|tara:strand:- start:3506 stop:4867 length:1362 start_codon:yes stop_codon:yes gene_type:complete
MKKIYSFIIATVISIGIANSQTIVFSSNLSSWSGGTPNLPTDFMGSKTNLEADSIIQVTTNNMYGMYAAQLINKQSSHKRFTTQPVTVTNGKDYEIKAWVRGAGDIRFGMFDGRTTGFGYAGYSSYVSFNTLGDTMISATITCAQDTSLGQFIISVRNTMAPNDIIVDSVVVSEVTATPPANVSVYDIQYTTNTNGDSPYNGQTVNTGGIVTAIRNGMDTVGFYIQNGANASAWNGIYVYHPVQSDLLSLNIGDSVTFTADVTEYYNLTELSNVQNLTVVSSNNTVNPASVQGAAVNTEMYEGVLVKVSQATCTDPNAGFGMFKIYDNTDTVLVDDVIYKYIPALNNVYNITGVVDYSYSEYKMLPRMASDVEDVTGVNELSDNSIALYPNPATDFISVENIKGNINIIDITGKVIKTVKSNASRTTINVSGFAKGIYFIQLENGAVAKFIKQ